MTVKLTERRRGALAALYVATEYNTKKVRSAELYDTASTVSGVELLRSQMDASAIMAEMKGEFIYSHDTPSRGNQYSLRQKGVEAVVDMELPGDLSPADLGGPLFAQ
jgi:hypothetical protein